MQVLNIKLTYN